MNNDYKLKMLQSGLFTKTGTNNEYRCNCPYCGDTKKHMYVYIDINSDDIVRYNCFRCPAKGYLNSNKLLKDLGIDAELPKGIKQLKKLNVDTCVSFDISDLINDGDDVDMIRDYVIKRVGVRPTMEELKMFQYIGNVKEYVKSYLGDDSGNIDTSRVWFKMTNGGIIGRRVDDIDDMRWLKYKSNRIKGAGLYQMKTLSDPGCELNIMICEGVFDCIGLYYHYRVMDNCIYIAVCDKNYQKGIIHMLNKGIFGNSVNVHIFKDSNVDVDSIKINNDIVSLYKSVSIYGNMLYKDYGIDRSMFEIKRLRRL